MTWERKEMYVLKDAHGVIVRVQEEKPNEWPLVALERLRKAMRESNGHVSEYQKKKIAEKRLWMGD